MSRLLPKALSRKPFTYQEACLQGLTQYKIRKLLVAKIIERLEYGLYQVTTGDLSEEEFFRRATKRVGKTSAVCLLSALSFYELTDIIPTQVWLMVPRQKRIKSSNIRLYRAMFPKWKIGVHTSYGYSITSLERTIVETMTMKKLISPRLGIEALKIALLNKKTTANKVLEMAKRLDVQHRIIFYIEALS